MARQRHALVGLGAIAGIVVSAPVHGQPSQTCTQLTTRRYGVFVGRAANLLPQLPEFLAIAAVPCGYLQHSLTFFGSFDDLQRARFRADQLRQAGLEAVVHSFRANVPAVPDGYRAAVVLVEPTTDAPKTLTEVRSLATAQTATLGNRSVILAAPMSSLPTATALSAALRGRGLAAQAIGVSSIRVVEAATPRPTPSPSPSPTPSSPPQRGTFRLLVPATSVNTLGQVRRVSPDAFERLYQGQRFVQVRSYSDRANAQRELERLRSQFPGIRLVQE